MIAGHLFGLEGRCACGYRFGDISGVTRADIGSGGWAHSGSLIEREYDEIVVERDRIWGLLCGVATGSGGGAETGGLSDG